MAKTALEDFWAFAADFRSMTAWVAKGAVAAPFIDIILGFGPPWPSRTGVPVLTCLVEILVLIYAFQFWKVMAKYQQEFRLRTSFVLIVVTFLLYIALFAFFVYEAPEAPYREVKGFLYQPYVHDIMNKDKTYTEQKVLIDSGYDPIIIWKPWTVYLMRIVVLITWILFFTALSTSISSFVLLQQHSKSQS